MDPTTFAALLQRAARQTTRRAALATLLGGALLLHAPAASEATREAQRRKDRDRKQRRRQAQSHFLKPIWVWIYNPGPNSVGVGIGDFQDNVFNWVCRGRSSAQVAPGATLPFASHDPDAYVWLNRTYALEFWNPFLAPPRVSAAVNGISVAGAGRVCPPRGTTVLSRRPLDVGDTVLITINDGVFSVTRNPDTNYKVFTVTLPATL